jgi:hypothetical protein
VQLSNPFIRMNFDIPFNRYFAFGERLPGDNHTWALPDGQEQVLSLRRRFVLNETNDLLLVYRRYASRRRSGGQTGDLGGAHCSVASTHTHGVRRDITRSCDVIVMNRRGAGVCLNASGGTVTPVQTFNEPFSTLVSALLPADAALTDNVDNAMWRKLTLQWSQNEYADSGTNRRNCLRFHDSYYCGTNGYGMRDGWTQFSPKCYGSPSCVGDLIGAEMRRYAGAGFYPLFLTDQEFYNF